MLMLCVGRFVPTVRPADAGPADADDTVYLGACVPTVRPADAGDAVCLDALCPQYVQLMLMMLAIWALCVHSIPC